MFASLQTGWIHTHQARCCHIIAGLRTDRRIAWGSARGLEQLPVLDHVAQTEVHDLDAAVPVQQEVLRLEILENIQQQRRQRSRETERATQNERVALFAR